jgi:hypothetical protein
MKFRILRGCHGQKINGRTVLFSQGDVVESDTDLAARFNSNGNLGKKFVPVADDTPVTVRAGAVPAATPTQKAQQSAVA